MAETKHSPLPWTIAPFGPCLMDANRDHAVCIGHADDRCGMWSAADAAFICKAVNSHAALVAALKDILCEVRDSSDLKAVALAAIAKAEGQ